MKPHFLIALGLIAAVCLTPVRAQQVNGEPVDGITNLHRLETAFPFPLHR